MQKTRKSEGICEQTTSNDGLLELAFEDSEEEKKSDGLEEINARMAALSIRSPQEDQSRSDGSWILLDDENSNRPRDAQSNSASSDSYVLISNGSPPQTI